MNISRFFRILRLTVAGAIVLPATLIFAQTPEPTPLPSGLTIHVVQRNETLFGIARAAGTTVDYLVSMNSISDAGNIQVGQRLLIPSADAITSQEVTHEVLPGENLTGIAALYQVTVADLQALNNLASMNQLYPGQILKIGVAPAASDNATAVPAVTVTPLPADSTDGVPLVGSNIHTVISGETLFRIATQYHLSVHDVAVANNISDPTLIYTGQQLIIPGSHTEPSALDLPAPMTGLSVKPLIFTEGETGSFRVTTETSSIVTIEFLGKQLPIVSEDALQHSAVVGIPMFTDAGIYPVTITAGNTSYTFNMRVASGGYGSQNITVDPDLVAPVTQEYEESLMVRLTGTFTEPRYFTGSFGLPAAAPMNSPFGTRRSYNNTGSETTYHTGADFASPPGAAIMAAGQGKVVLADLLNLRGNTVVIDHGQGIFTVYCHMSKINVQLGQIVDAGQIVGLTGSTGRITGPHLHWEVWISGVPVNPLQWLTESFP